MSGVKWCKIMGVARSATVQLSVGTEQREKGSLSWPSPKGLSHGPGSVAWASILEPDDDLLDISKGQMFRGSTAQWRYRLVNLSPEKGLAITIWLLYFGQVSLGDQIFSINRGNRAYWFSRTSFPRWIGGLQRRNDSLEEDKTIPQYDWDHKLWGSVLSPCRHDLEIKEP